MRPDLQLGTEALDKFLEYPWEHCLDIGSGTGWQAKKIREAGRDVTVVDLIHGQDYIKEKFQKFDAIWCCHVLEHQKNPNIFLEKIFNDLKDGGILAITVPVAKHNLVGGHVTLWNPAILLYNLILAGFDCRQARVGSYGYNHSVILRKNKAELPELCMDEGDIESLSAFFPAPVEQNSLLLEDINWHVRNHSKSQSSVGRPLLKCSPRLTIQSGRSGF